MPLDTTAVVTLGLERGFVSAQFGLVSEQDLLGERISRPPRRRKSADQFIAEATEIAEGDLVVHQDYGIGRYDGLETLRVGPAPHDCLRLIYDGNEKLYLPSRTSSFCPASAAKPAVSRSTGSAAPAGRPARPA